MGISPEPLCHHLHSVLRFPSSSHLLSPVAPSLCTLQEWFEQQEAIKNEPLEVTYSYWDGSGHRRKIVVCSSAPKISSVLTAWHAGLHGVMGLDWAVYYCSCSFAIAMAVWALCPCAPYQPPILTMQSSFVLACDLPLTSLTLFQKGRCPVGSTVRLLDDKCWHLHALLHGAPSCALHRTSRMCFQTTTHRSPSNHITHPLAPIPSPDSQG